MSCLPAGDLWWRPHAGALPRDGLDRPLTIQGFATTPLAAVYHVVEHFAWHTGQLVALAKQRAGPSHGLFFYDDEALARGSPAPDP